MRLRTGSLARRRPAAGAPGRTAAPGPALALPGFGRVLRLQHTGNRSSFSAGDATPNSYGKAAALPVYLSRPQHDLILLGSAATPATATHSLHHGTGWETDSKLRESTAPLRTAPVCSAQNRGQRTLHHYRQHSRVYLAC